MTVLEDEFRRARSMVQSRIEAEIKTANEALNRAKLLADTTGVPFDIYLEVNGTRLQYVPDRFRERFAQLDFIVTGVEITKLDSSCDEEEDDEDWDASDSCWDDRDDSGCSWNSSSSYC